MDFILFFDFLYFVWFFCWSACSLDEIDGRLNDLEKNLDSSIKSADGIQGADGNLPKQKKNSNGQP